MITKRPNYRRKRHGIYIPPVMKLLSLLVFAGILAVIWHFYQTAQPEPPDGGDGNLPSAPLAASELPEHMTTPSGVPCTLLDLGADAIKTGDLILVNNDNFFQFPENQEEELVCILEERTNSYYVKDATVLLLPQAMAALNDMMDAFHAQGGKKSVQIIAGHRTADYQQHLFDQSAARNGLEHAKRYVARPGGSEHHTGLVVDMGTTSGEFMNSTGEYTWITENCQDYGWIVRYEAGKEELTGIWDEPWHFRYVGAPHASEIVRNGFCLEEYMDYLKGFPLDGEHLVIDCAAGKYEVWYAQGSRTYVPDGYLYSVSGNNSDGVIITCRIG